jgi:hypothetical protein
MSSRDHVKKFFVFRNFVGSEDRQRRLVNETLQCHAHNEATKGGHDVSTMWQSIGTSKTSLNLNLGIPCGGDLTHVLPDAALLARQAFLQASMETTNATTKTLQSLAQGPLSGLALLYGVEASMPSHYDSPTQPNQREEWLVMMTLGNTVVFRCDNEIISLHSGDALVMDSMAVLHGVDRIVPDHSDHPICSVINLPDLQVRLGILFWQGRDEPKQKAPLLSEEGIHFVGMDGLFDEEID